MRRREFISLLGGAAAWPLAVRAQQGLPRVGILMFSAESDPEGRIRVAALLDELQKLNWTPGKTVQIDIRWAAGDPILTRKYAAELITLAPKVIVATASEATGALLQATQTIPVVFVNVSDPVGAGYVRSLAKPGGNATGFTFVEYGMSGKWLELLKEIAPKMARVAVLRDPTLPVGIGQLGAIQSVAPSFGVEATPVDVRDPALIERGITDFAHQADKGGLIVTASPIAIVHRKLIVDLASRYRLPSIYFSEAFVREGGLISYGPELIGPYRQAASYVDQIIKGANPSDLPVQAPTNYQTVINRKAAQVLGLTIPPTLLTRADQVIE